MAPPPEPMLAFATTASLCYALVWWICRTVLESSGVELEYSEES
ncbi:hypothetical protein RBH26_16245 [Natronolimnohabitans sp. A-GB9]|nr:hypothetical protein [Natronolimnohabitans sp. A-GB9]MDQ2052028.1 hypothetical protein [Natronolimnohabitans sp. A-GB9]